MGNENSREDLLNPEGGKRIIWAWESNSNATAQNLPEDQTEWTLYPNEQAIIIEKAYLDPNEELADIGDYCVLVSSMLEYKKDNTKQRRRVIRQVINQPMRQTRFSSEPSKPKSVNSPFGTLNDFKEFLMPINSNCRVFESLELGGTAQLFFMFGNNTFGRETS